ncbi:MAG: hypothetical protein M3464_06090 [Chloroflexota bacterium]|nr:hypothetical protein [Chloroflexota bacterium]
MTTRRPTLGQQLTALVADCRREGIDLTLEMVPIASARRARALGTAPVRQASAAPVPAPVVEPLHCANCGAMVGVGPDGYCGESCRHAWLHECGDCQGVGWMEEWEPLNPSAGDDGYAIVPCGCPAGDEWSERYAVDDPCEAA